MKKLDDLGKPFNDELLNGGDNLKLADLSADDLSTLKLLVSPNNISNPPKIKPVTKLSKKFKPTTRAELTNFVGFRPVNNKGVSTFEPVFKTVKLTDLFVR
jgi:hypothetical protein